MAQGWLAPSPRREAVQHEGQCAGFAVLQRMSARPAKGHTSFALRCDWVRRTRRIGEALPMIRLADLSPLFLNTFKTYQILH